MFINSGRVNLSMKIFKTDGRENGRKMEINVLNFRLNWAIAFFFLRDLFQLCAVNDWFLTFRRCLISI